MSKTAVRREFPNSSEPKPDIIARETKKHFLKCKSHQQQKVCISITVKTHFLQLQTNLISSFLIEPLMLQTSRGWRALFRSARACVPKYIEPISRRNSARPVTKKATENGETQTTKKAVITTIFTVTFRRSLKKNT